MQEDATVIPSDTALRLATVNGAEALGFANVGALKTGNQADLVLISLDAPHLNPLLSDETGRRSVACGKRNLG